MAKNRRVITPMSVLLISKISEYYPVSRPTNLQSLLQAHIALLEVPQPLPGGRFIQSHPSPDSTRQSIASTSLEEDPAIGDSAQPTERPPPEPS